MKRRDAILAASPALVALLAACSSGGSASGPATSAPAASTASRAGTAPAGAGGAAGTAIPQKPDLVYVFSNSSPHVTVVDATTNKIARTKDIPGFTTWATNDDNNYFDGKNVWLGMRNPDNDDVEVVLLDLDTLDLGRRIPLGKDKTTVYIGKASKKGQLFVSKHASGEMAVVDTKTFQVLEVKQVPVNGGVACDMDVGTGTDGIERAFIPTDTGDTTIAVDTTTREVIQTYTHTKGIRPYMLTVSPDGKYLWVQERGSDGQIILDVKTFQPVKQVPTGKSAFMNGFTPDGKLSYVGHNADTRVVVVDANTFQTVKEIEVGTNAKIVACLPNGKALYAIATKENTVSAINTGNWQVTQRIQLAEAPEAVFVPRPA